MNSLNIKEILQTNPKDQLIRIEGWVRTKRASKNLTFLALSDGSVFDTIQIVYDQQNGIDQKTIEHLEKVSTGSAVTAIGKLVASPGQKQAVELQGTELIIEGEADPETYPLQKKRHSLEFLREIAHLRPRTNTIGAVMRVRNELSMAIHSFFQERGFIYCHTPILTGVDAEGAGAMFQATTLDLKDPPKVDGEIDYEQDFFGKKSYLAVTGQLEAEVYALAMKNAYTFGPTFRAENSNTSRHLAEFWMVEPEMAFCDINGNMDVAEDFLKYILNRVLKNCQKDMEFFNQWVEKGIVEILQSVVESKFNRISYDQAIKALSTNKDGFEFKPEWGCDLQSEHEKYLTEVVYNGPVIVTDYPKDIKAFYMKQNDDEKTVRAMDVLVPRLGEIIGGSEREADYGKLLSRMEEMGLNSKDYWWYLDLRKYGTVTHAGFGLGFERLIQYVTGMQNIRDVIPFPRAVHTIGF